MILLCFFANTFKICHCERSMGEAISRPARGQAGEPVLQSIELVENLGRKFLVYCRYVSAVCGLPSVRGDCFVAALLAMTIIAVIASKAHVPPAMPPRAKHGGSHLPVGRGLLGCLQQLGMTSCNRAILLNIGCCVTGRKEQQLAMDRKVGSKN